MGFVPALACSIVGRSARSCQIGQDALICCCLVVTLGLLGLLPVPGNMNSALVSSSNITGMGVLFLVCR